MKKYNPFDVLETQLADIRRLLSKDIPKSDLEVTKDSEAGQYIDTKAVSKILNVSTVTIANFCS